jgi:hypothetical protein
MTKTAAGKRREASPTRLVALDERCCRSTKRCLWYDILEMMSLSSATSVSLRPFVRNGRRPPALVCVGVSMASNTPKSLLQRLLPPSRTAMALINFRRRCWRAWLSSKPSLKSFCVSWSASEKKDLFSYRHNKMLELWLWRRQRCPEATTNRSNTSCWVVMYSAQPSRVDDTMTRWRSMCRTGRS